MALLLPTPASETDDGSFLQSLQAGIESVISTLVALHERIKNEDLSREHHGSGLVRGVSHDVAESSASSPRRHMVEPRAAALQVKLGLAKRSGFRKNTASKFITTTGDVSRPPDSRKSSKQQTDFLSESSERSQGRSHGAASADVGKADHELPPQNSSPKHSSGPGGDEDCKWKLTTDPFSVKVSDKVIFNANTEMLQQVQQVQAEGYESCADSHSHAKGDGHLRDGQSLPDGNSPLHRIASFTPCSSKSVKRPLPRTSQSLVTSLSKSLSIYRSKKKLSDISSEGDKRDQDEDGIFTVDPTWINSRMAFMKTLTTSKSRHCLNEQSSPDSDVAGPKHWLLSRALIQPHTPQRLLWDFCSVFFVLYDVVMIPLQFLDPPTTWLNSFMNHLMALYWSLDIFASLVTGFTREDGSIEMRSSAIARHYMRTWLMPDLLIVGIAWAEVLGGKGSLGMLTAFRAIKFLRLARLARIQAVLNAFVERVSSEMLSLCISFAGCVFAIAGLTHVVACIWVGIGKHRDESWVNRLGLLGNTNMQYAIAYHWGLTQFTGAMELAPVTLTERIFASGSLLAGFLTATAFVSTMTSLATQLHMISNDRTKKLKSLNRYLNDNKISMKVARRVLQNAKFVLYKQNQHVAEEHITLLPLISESLRIDLHFEIHMSCLAYHVFFGALFTECQNLLRQFCHKGIFTKMYMRDDEIFRQGEVSLTPAMMFITGGAFSYAQDLLCETMAEIGQWACEHVLWCACWVHHGTLWAMTDAHLSVLDARSFRDIIGSAPGANPFFAKISNYAVAFVKMLNSDLEALTDFGNPELAKDLLKQAGAEPTKKTTWTRSSRSPDNYRQSSILPK